MNDSRQEFCRRYPDLLDGQEKDEALLHLLEDLDELHTHPSPPAHLVNVNMEAIQAGQERDFKEIAMIKRRDPLPPLWGRFNLLVAASICALLLGAFPGIFYLARHANIPIIPFTTASKPASHTPSTNRNDFTENTLTHIEMISARVGWAWNKSNALLRTTDGAQTWQFVNTMYALPPDDPGASSHKDWYFLSETAAWIFMNNQLVYTLDGGNSWNTSEISWPSHKALDSLRNITFIDTQHGWLIVNIPRTEENRATNRIHATTDRFAVYATSDGGKTWQKVAESSTDETAEAGQLPLTSSTTGLSFVNASKGWITGLSGDGAAQPYLYMTTDGGKTWQAQTLSTPEGARSVADMQVHPPRFFSAQDGVLPVTFGTHGTTYNIKQGVALFETHDGGITWQSKPFFPFDFLWEGSECTDPNGTVTGKVCSQSSYSVPPPVMLNEQFGWLSGNAMYTTNNGGTSWKFFPLASHIIQTQFVSPQFGWALAYHKERTNGQTYLLKTGDGGKNWQEMYYTIERR